MAMGNLDLEEFSLFVNTDPSVVKHWQECVSSESDSFSVEIKNLFKLLIEKAGKCLQENYSVK